MKILSISAQKPSSTGSGIYLLELVKSLQEMGHEQAVVAGVSKESEMQGLPEDIQKYPVCFQTKELPYPVVGMSDEMPYESTRYCDLTPQMVEQFIQAFRRVVKNAVEVFEPEIILCHHLYLMTAVVRELYPEKTIYGFCHNTDLRQLQKTDLKRDYIKEKIRLLDKVFVLHDAQKEIVKELYQMDESKMEVLGMGFNSSIFYPQNEIPKSDVVKMIFAGKIAEKKGVKSLMRAMVLLKNRMDEKKELELYLAGGAGNQKEYDEIIALSKESPYPVHFLGKLTQVELAKYYNMCDIFVLPSFFEGLPLTVIEALACGDRVVMTRLPGIPQWIAKHALHAEVIYVDPPEMVNTDEALKESLAGFEEYLAEALAESINKEQNDLADVSGISWRGIAKKVIG